MILFEFLLVDRLPMTLTCKLALHSSSTFLGHVSMATKKENTQCLKATAQGDICKLPIGVTILGNV